ncbi:MAG: alpha/beta hydrolase [Myxococcota bacterium]
MPLDPRIAAIAAATPAQDYTTIQPDALRRYVEDYTPAFERPGPAVATRDLSIPGPASTLFARRYQAHPGQGLPLVLFFHGGGFVTGSVRTTDSICRAIAQEVPAIVVNAEYRLAPEHPFPAAVEDVRAVLAWCHAEAEALGIDPTRIAVMGESAGANLAAVLAHLVRDEGGPALRHQALVYPGPDASRSSPSMEENADGAFLTRESIEFYDRCYVPRVEDRKDPRVSPILYPSFAGLPSATIVTAECDPVRDEGRAYARCLEEAGIDVVLREYAGMPHGFFGMHALVEASEQAIVFVARRLRGALIG